LVELQWRNSIAGKVNTTTDDEHIEPAETEAGDPLLAAMGYDPASIDALMERVDLPADQLMLRITELEIEGIITALPGGKYQRMR
jgi:DNA processing protein